MKSSVLRIILGIAFLFLLACNKKQRNTSIKNLYQQNIESREWRTNSLIGEGVNDQVIKFLEEDLQKSRIYGLVANFKNNTFTSRNVSKCGNDYFTHVYGKYEFFDQDKIMISVDSITYSGEWKKPTFYPYNSEIEYLISKDTKGLLFTKIE